MADPNVNELIRRIYDTTLNPEQWTDVLSEFADRIGALGIIISEIEGIGDSRRIVTPYLSRRYDPEQIQKYLKRNIHFEFMDQARYETLSRASDTIDLIDQRTLAGSRLDEFLARPNVQKMRANGIRERAGGLLDKDNTLRSRFSIHFGDNSPGLTDEIHAMLAELLPHVAKAIEVGRGMRQSRALNTKVLATMDRQRMGICILDRFGRVELANAEFKRQIQDYPAYSVDQDQVLKFHESFNSKRLSGLLSDIGQHGKHGARPRKEALILDSASDVLESADIGVLCIEVAPIHRVEEFGNSIFDGAIVYSLDTTRPIPFDPTVMSERFSLSKAETDLLELVAQGMSNPEIAEQRCRAVDTINAQVKALLNKTGAKNRTHLVRLMACFGTDYLFPAEEPPRSG